MLMSDNLLRLIPTDEQYVPNDSAQEQARRLLASYVPQAEAVYAEVSDDVRFIDPGANRTDPLSGL
jgi:hypothetical protein